MTGPPLGPQSDPDTPGIVIEPTTFWCPAHLEPFRTRWPDGYLPASMYLLGKALIRDDIHAACGGRTEMLDRVLREFGPICCLLDAALVHDVTERALSPDREVVAKLMLESSL